MEGFPTRTAPPLFLPLTVIIGRHRQPRTKAVWIGEAGYAWCSRKTPPCPGSAARLCRKSPKKSVLNTFWAMWKKLI